MKRIGIVSDTHGLLRPEVAEKLALCSLILHAGDIDRQEVLDDLQDLAETAAVRGNADKRWAEKLPITRKIDLEGRHILLVHNKRDLPKDLTGIDLVIFGHTHRYEDRIADHIRFLNPGSCGPRLPHQPVTMAVLEVCEEGWEIRKVEIPHGTVHRTGAVRSEDREPERVTGDMVAAVMKDLSRARSVEQIAKKHKISPELAGEICRMYVTHPGVSVEGILSRLGL